MPRLVKVRAAIRGAKPGTRARVWASDSAGALGAAPIAVTQAKSRITPVQFGEEWFGFTPFCDEVNWAGFAGASFCGQPFCAEELELTFPTRRYEHGRLPFGVSRLDPNGLESLVPPAVGYCHVNSSPAGHAAVSLSHGAGIFTLSLVDHPEA